MLSRIISTTDAGKTLQNTAYDSHYSISIKVKDKTPLYSEIVYMGMDVNLHTLQILHHMEEK